MKLWWCAQYPTVQVIMMVCVIFLPWLLADAFQALSLLSLLYPKQSTCRCSTDCSASHMLNINWGAQSNIQVQHHSYHPLYLTGIHGVGQLHHQAKMWTLEERMGGNSKGRECFMWKKMCLGGVECQVQCWVWHVQRISQGGIASNSGTRESVWVSFKSSFEDLISAERSWHGLWDLFTQVVKVYHCSYPQSQGT